MFVKMTSDHGHFLLKTLQWLSEPSKEVQTVLHSFFSVLIFIPLHHFIPQITWILSCQETKDGQASQETGAGSVGSSVPLCDLHGSPCHLPSLCALPFSALVCSERTTSRLPGLAHWLASDHQRWRLVPQAPVQVPGNVNLMDAPALPPLSLGMITWALAMNAGCHF